MVKDNGRGDPDRGPPMMEGEHTYDKGYVSDHERFCPDDYPHDQRGNAYFNMRNEVVRKDSAKLKRTKFSKYA